MSTSLQELQQCHTLQALEKISDSANVACQMGNLIGRRFQLGRHNGTVCLNDIVKRFAVLSQNLEGPDKEHKLKTCSKIAANIEALDKLGNVTLRQQSCLYKILTWICQFFGNRSFDRIAVLQGIEKNTKDGLQQLEKDKDAEAARRAEEELKAEAERKAKESQMLMNKINKLPLDELLKAWIALPENQITDDQSFEKKWIEVCISRQISKETTPQYGLEDESKLLAASFTICETNPRARVFFAHKLAEHAEGTLVETCNMLCQLFKGKNLEEFAKEYTPILAERVRAKALISHPLLHILSTLPDMNHKVGDCALEVSALCSRKSDMAENAYELLANSVVLFLNKTGQEFLAQMENDIKRNGDTPAIGFTLKMLYDSGNPTLDQFLPLLAGKLDVQGMVCFEFTSSEEGAMPRTVVEDFLNRIRPTIERQPGFIMLRGNLRAAEGKEAAIMKILDDRRKALHANPEKAFWKEFVRK